MSLASRLTALAQAIGADIKAIATKLGGIEEGAQKNAWDQLKAVALVGGVATLDLSSPAGFRVTLTGNTALAFSNVPTGRVVVFTVTFVQDATGGRLVIYPGNVKADGGGVVAQPATAAGAVTVQSFYTDDGGATIWQARDLSGLGTGDNLLINPLFRINQRGYVSGTATTGANQYTLDRWRVVTSGQSLTFSAASIGNQITAPAGGVEQVIEGVNNQGGVHTLTWSGTATATVNGTAINNGGQTASLTAGANVTVRFIGGTVREAKFESGAVATPFRSPLFSADLLLCQRYCVVYTLGNGEGLANGTVTSSTSAYSWLLLPTTMRTSSAAVVVSSGLAFYDPSSRSGTIAAKLQTPFMLQVGITGSSGMSPGGSGYFAWLSGGKITIDAEL
ncbi:hypothetical protein NA655_08640 [Pseudomonas kuykendallii]|uniref:Uncharacterized protein n=1 Tax=Pseudomonas kuykendallii TaxID=1007099 RepID=A0A1H3EI17_9PSED|nr:hypothetical protein [Pseudomonas kuykendallii]MCQ4271087.1 hypothetical protein [Pseudomonas kuykendallii]SDX78413.1 hypothetical protein SAMN05216287_3734 [Pseudomonas kuykendallii]